VDVLGYLRKNLGKATQDDVDLLYEEDRKTYERIEVGEKIRVIAIMKDLRNKLRTRTRAFIHDTYGLFFAGPVPGAAGQIGTRLQYVIHGTHTLVAKIAGSEKLNRDVDTASRVFNQVPPIHKIGASPTDGPRIQWPQRSIPTVMPILAVVQIPGASKHSFTHQPDVGPVSKGGEVDTAARPDRIAIIFPAYVRSVASLLHAVGTCHCGDVTIANVALCVLAAIKAFDQVGLIHADIKPDNLMLSFGRNAEIVLIDFGAAVEHGEALVEWSPKYSLGVTTTTVEYDLACLAAVLYELGGGDLEEGTTVHDVINASRVQSRLVDKLVLNCLDARNVTTDGKRSIDVVWQKCRAACENEVGDCDGFLNVNRLWPDCVTLPDEGKGLA
jgi:hypothetical protein